MKGAPFLAAGAVFLLAIMFSGPPSRRRPSPLEPPDEEGGDDPASLAEREAAHWAGMVETDPSALPRIQEYWAATGLPYPGSVETPWSAAFISWVVERSSRRGALTPSGAHIFYAQRAYYDRGMPGRYGAFPRDKVAIEPGDIVIKGRSGSGLSWDDIAKGSGLFIPTHGDIVTRVQPGEAAITGGNVRNAVVTRPMPLDAQGRAADPDVIAVLKYQPGESASV